MPHHFQLNFRDLLTASSEQFSDYLRHPPKLETSRLILRQIRMQDAEDIFEWSSDERVARYVLWEPHQSISETRDYIRYIRSAYRHRLPSSWAIELKTNGQVIGTIGFMWISYENRSAEVGYSMSSSFWGQGLMPEALHRLLDFSFEYLKLNRVEAQYDTRNPASGRVLEKCGMVREGILRQRIYNKGEYIDVCVCAILASDKR